MCKIIFIMIVLIGDAESVCDKKECAKKYIDALQTERIIIIRLIFLYRNLLTVDDIQTIAVDVCLNTIDSIYSSIL